MEEYNQKQICYSSQEIEKIVCKTRVDPFQTHVPDIITFFTETYYSGVSYKSICMTRMTLNTVVILLGYPDVSGHPLIKRCIKVVFNTKPPKPMYIYAWDINKALSYIASIGCDEILSDKILSQKPVILLL